MKPSPVWFAPSDKVVLVDGDGMDPAWWDLLPVEGRVYCVRKVKYDAEDGMFLVKLVGIHTVQPADKSWRSGYPHSCWFNADRFCLAQAQRVAASRRKRKEGT